MLRRKFLAAALQSAELPDIRSVEPDLVVPALSDGLPAAGRRVKVGGGTYHVLYLPTDWKPGGRYPVIVEYAGNGNYQNSFGDISTGRPEGSNLGYGLSGGRGFIWLCLPYIDPVSQQNQLIWWGNPDATTAYCRTTVEQVCRDFGGDRRRIVLAGFSRGAIACNYIGLRDPDTARLWRAFFAYSHYDGVRRWNYPEDDREAALRRLSRVENRPVFICHERSVEPTREYLTSAGIKGRFTLRALPFRNHNDAWVLRDIPLRREARAWLTASVSSGG
jgi:hypothetical protein